MLRLNPVGKSQHGAKNDSYTKAMLHMDGTDASTTFTDEPAGASAHTFTAAGTAQIDTAIKHFGTAAGLFDGNSDYISAPNSADFEFGSGDFTVDFWFNRAGGDGTYRSMCGITNSALNDIHLLIRLTDANAVQGIVITDGNNGNVTGTTAFTATGWHHCALFRHKDRCYMAIDGIIEHSNVITGTVSTPAEPLVIGKSGSFAGQYWNGSIDEFRLSVGVARWLGDFAPPSVPYDV